MKTSFKIISLIVSVCIVLSALPLIFSVTATESEPVLPNRCEVVISEEGVDGDFGSKYNELASKTKIIFSPTIDLSSEENFELDIYVEDADALKSAIENSPGTGEQGLNLYFGSATIDLLYASNNIAWVDISAQITGDGWNHITVSKAAFTEKSINWANAKYIFLKFNDNITNAHTDLANTSVKLRNICTVISLPEIADGNTVIYSDLLNTTLGKDENSLYSEIANRFKVSDLETVDISNNSHIGIDFKVSDFDKFNNMLNDENVSARLVLTSETGESSVELDNSIRESKNAGWHNAIVALSNLTSGKINGFYINMVNTDADAKLGANYNIELSIVNIYAVDMTAPTENTAYGYIVSDFQVNALEYTVGKFYKDFTITQSSEVGALGNSAYIEFDLFVEEYNAFENSFTYDAKGNEVTVDLQLIVSNLEDCSQNTLVWSAVQNNVVYGGWNHIILPISNGVNNGFDMSQAIKCWKLEITGLDIEKQNSYANQLIILDSLCATEYKTPVQANEYDTVSVMTVDGKQWKLGDTFKNSNTNEYNMATGADFSEIMFVEFDVYVQNYEAWKSKMAEGNVSGITMRYSSTTGTNYSNDSRSAGFLDYITHSGWNHICMPFGNFKKGATSGWLDVSNITTYQIYYGGTNSSQTGNLEGQYMSVANINGTTIKMPEEYMGMNTVVAELGAPASSGTYTNNYKMSLTTAADTAVDFSKASFIEFDIYIEDYEEFVESFKTDVNGKEVGVNLCFGIGMTSTYADKNGYFQWNGIQNYIKKDGWNHVSLAIGGQDRSSSAPNGVKTIENIQCWRLWYGGDSYKKGDYINRIGDDLVIIANIAATAIIDPEQPDNVLAQVGTSKSATLGAQYHYTGDRLYEGKLTASDFSQGTIIEFDIYVDDYEALLEVEAQSTRKSKLALYLSSTPANLFGQYNKPWNYYNGYITISDKITHNGWNHIVVGRADFKAANQTIDWTNINGWNIKFTTASNVHPEYNPYPNITVRICNIVNTGIVANIPKDGEKESKFDKEAVYISSADAIADTNGSWNPSTTYVTEDYRSEGKGSIALDLNYLSELSEARMYYLFDDTADFSDLKTLKFDFFIDLPQFIKADGNKAEIVMANHRNATDDYYKWNLDFSSLKEGWNSLNLDINDAVKSGNPMLNEAKVVLFRFTELNIDAKVFAEIVIGIDNLRYISSTGSTTLKINGFDNEDLSNTVPDNNENDEISDVVFNEIVNDTEQVIINKDPIIITSEPETKYVKTIKKIIHQDYLTAGIILGVEAAVLTAAVIIFMVVYRKKKKAK